MISWRALGVGSLGWRGRLAWRLNSVRPTQFSTQSPPHVLERMERSVEKLQRSVEELQRSVEDLQRSTLQGLDHISRQGGFEVYLLSRLDSLEKTFNEHVKTFNEHVKTLNEQVKTLNEQVETLNGQMKMQTSYHIEWCQRDLSVLSAEILKWSIGMRGASGGDGRHFYVTPNQQDVETGAQVFARKVEDYKDFSCLVILDHTHHVHFGSLKVLDERVETAQRYIRDFGSYLRISRAREVEVIHNYAALKKALPNQFC